MRGTFITLEGSEGAGKSTALGFIEKRLGEAGVALVVTREPGGTPIGEQLRALLLDAKNQGICDDTELLLMFAARAQHLGQLILPALNAGKWVLCDRFTDATYAYQGGGRGIELSRIAQLEQWVQGDLRPDFTILLDVPVEVGMQRIEKRGEPDRFEREQTAFFEKVRQTYLRRAELNPKQYKIVDASQPLNGVQAQLEQIISEIFQ
jgi:dTMP kinase